MQNLHDPGGKWDSNAYAMCQDPSAVTDQTGSQCAVTQWHTYGLNWDPDSGSYQWLIDGQVTKNVSKADTKVFPTKAMYFVLNNGVAFEKIPSDPEATPFPNYVDVDYVRVWEAA